MKSHSEDYVPPKKVVNRWIAAHGITGGPVRDELYFDWLRTLPNIPAIPNRFPPTYGWMVEILRILSSKDKATLKKFRMWERQRRQREADLATTLAIIREALEYRGEITDEMISSYLHKIQSALPYNGAMA